MKAAKSFACSNEQLAQRAFWETWVEVCSLACLWLSGRWAPSYVSKHSAATTWRSFLNHAWQRHSMDFKGIQSKDRFDPIFFFFTIWLKNEANGCNSNWVNLYAVNAIFFSFLFFIYCLDCGFCIFAIISSPQFCECCTKKGFFQVFIVFYFQFCRCSVEKK